MCASEHRVDAWHGHGRDHASVRDISAGSFLPPRVRACVCACAPPSGFACSYSYIMHVHMGTSVDEEVFASCAARSGPPLRAARRKATNAGVCAAAGSSSTRFEHGHEPYAMRTRGAGPVLSSRLLAAARWWGGVRSSRFPMSCVRVFACSRRIRAGAFAGLRASAMKTF